MNLRVHGDNILECEHAARIIAAALGGREPLQLDLNGRLQRWRGTRTSRKGHSSCRGTYWAETPTRHALSGRMERTRESKIGAGQSEMAYSSRYAMAQNGHNSGNGDFPKAA